MSAVTGNAFLDSLQEATRARVLQSCRRGTISKNQYLFRAGTEAPYLYFLTSGMASMLIDDGRGSAAEIASVGNSGVIGASALLGNAPTTFACVMRTHGEAYRMTMTDARQVLVPSLEIFTPLLQLIQNEMFDSARRVFCNTNHPADQRLATWLLTHCKLTGSAEVPVIQEQLAGILGVRRTTVALISTNFQRSGLIDQRRGGVFVRNPHALEKVACTCLRGKRSAESRDEAGLPAQSLNLTSASTLVM